MSVRTTFEKLDGSMTVEVDMPYPVRVGEEVEIYETGYNMTVVTVVWIIKQEDELNEKSVELFASVR